MRDHAEVEVISDERDLPKNAKKGDYLVQIAEGHTSAVRRAMREVVARLRMRPVGRLVEYKLLVPSSRSGAILGRGGELINEVRQATGASITFLPEEEGDAERVLCCVSSGEDSGSTLLPAQAALHSLAERVVDPDSHPRERFPVRLLVSGPLTRSLIGRGGNVVNSLRDQYNCHIRIRQHGRDNMPFCADEEDSIVEIPSGNLKSCMGALRAITQHLRTAELGSSGGPHSQSSQPEEPGTTVVRTVIPSSQAGAVIGRGGANISQMRQVSGARVQLFSPRTDNSRLLEMSGSQEEVQAAQSVLQALLVTSEQADASDASFAS